MMTKRLLLIGSLLLVPDSGVVVAQQGDLEIWSEFRGALRSRAMADSARYRPLHPDLLQPMIGYLEEIRRAGILERGQEPEVFHVGDRVHYLIPFTGTRDSTATTTFCFSLVLEEGRWYFQHLESIVIRLDKITVPPVSTFPDLPAEQKAWIRDEVQLSRDVRLFDYLRREKGTEAALEWFKDGRGYALQAQVWVPFLAPERAFILYVAWDLSNLRGEKAVLEGLGDDEARIRFRPRAFAIYDQASHLQQQITIDDFRRLFEVVWLDRARSAGWELRISYEGNDCVFRFLRAGTGVPKG
jgi:hypothetical protein